MCAYVQTSDIETGRRVCCVALLSESEAKDQRRLRPTTHASHVSDVNMRVDMRVDMCVGVDMPREPALVVCGAT